MNEQYTYIEIRKTAPSVFEIYDNTSPNSAVASSDYAGRIMPFEGIYNNDSSFTITTKTGHPLYNHQLWSVFRYVDAINGNNSFIPVSGLDLFRKLTARGFFDTDNVESPVDTIDQDNIDKVKGFRYPMNTVLTDQDVVNKLNTLATWTINEKESYYFRGIQYQNNANNFPVPTGNTLLYKMLNKGKGTYGVNGTPLTTSDIVLVDRQMVTAQDIENDPTTDIVEYDLAEGQTISQWLNTQNPVITIKPVDEGYTLFKSEGQPTYLFVGDSGTYGTGEAQSTDADFESFSNEIPSAGVQSVGGYGVDITDPQNPVIVTPANEYGDIFISSCTVTQEGNPKTSIRFLKPDNTFYYIDIAQFVPTVINPITEIILIGNRLFMTANSTTSTNETLPIKVIIADLNYVNGAPKLSNFSDADITVKIRVHGSVLHRGFVYLSTRPNVGNAVPTQVVKINPNNLTDVDILEIPDTRSTDIIGYKNNVYIHATNAAQDKMRFIRIDENLNNYSIIFEWNRVAVFPYKQPQANPFLIYNDEIYTAYAVIDGTATRKYVSVDVYNFKGELVRSNNVDTNPQNLTRRTYYAPHWLTIFNGKIIITPTDTTVATPPSTNPWSVLVIDVNTLTLEDIYQLPCSISDDNTIFGNGDIYFNGEGSSTALTSLSRANYKNLAGTFEILKASYNSNAALNSKYPFQEAQIVNVSQLNYDFKYQPGIIYLTAKGWQNGVKNTGASIELNDVIFYFGSDGKYGNWQYINATSDNNTQNINNYLFFGTEINA